MQNTPEIFLQFLFFVRVITHEEFYLDSRRWIEQCNWYLSNRFMFVVIRHISWLLLLSLICCPKMKSSLLFWTIKSLYICHTWKAKSRIYLYMNLYCYQCPAGNINPVLLFPLSVQTRRKLIISFIPQFLFSISFSILMPLSAMSNICTWMSTVSVMFLDIQIYY